DECRRHQLSSRRRAVQNLAWALMEEGDIAATTRLLDELRGLDLATGHGLATSFVDEAGRSYYAGDWAAAVRAATALMNRPATAAAVLLGADEAARVRGMLKRSPGLTPWGESAMSVLEGRITGDATCYLDGAEGYARIGDASARVLALAAAARTLVEAGDVER